MGYRYGTRVRRNFSVKSTVPPVETDFNLFNISQPENVNMNMIT